MTAVEQSDDLFLSNAQDALRSTNGDASLLVLGWKDLLTSLDDPEARLAIFSYFRAQGRELGSSGALGTLMAQPYAGLLDTDGTTRAIVERISARRGRRAIVVGAPEAGQILVDRPGEGISLVAVDALDLRPIGLSDGLALYEIETDLLPINLGEHQVAAARDLSLQLGRTALAVEVLGAAEGALTGAVQYARDRQQFGHPIGHFQAVRHLLATARADVDAIEALAEQAIDLFPCLPTLHDLILKAAAGRNGRRICQRSLQVLGAMGFTVEHEHHRYHSRVLVLDTLLGSSNSLTHQLALSLRASQGAVPNLHVPISAG
jgi:hypothetical protein